MARLVDSLCELGGIYSAQELHELSAHLIGGFVFVPMADIVEFEMPHETRKAGAELVHRRIELLQAIDLPCNEEG